MVGGSLSENNLHFFIDENDLDKEFPAKLQTFSLLSLILKAKKNPLLFFHALNNM